MTNMEAVKIDQRQDGDILNCTSNGVLGKLIKKFTKSNFNHSALVIEVWGELFIIDSQKDGTQLRPIKDWDKKMKYGFAISRPKEFTTEMKNRAIEKIGFTKYDFASLLWWQPLYLITGKWRGRSKEKASKRLYCSEFVAYVFDMPSWWNMSPKAVFEYTEKSNDFDIIF